MILHRGDPAEEDDTPDDASPDEETADEAAVPDEETDQEPEAAEPEAPAAAPAQAQPAAQAAAPEQQPKKGPPLAANEVYVPGSDADRQAALYAKDIERGHIKPKTMQDLYDSKDTPGKIGTLFGLMVSGMGSGLTGQPNAVMEMMNKELERDLDAQKSSNTNAQNWYQKTLQHELQRAQIPNLQSETELHKAQTGLIKMQAEIAASSAAMNYMQLDAWGDLQKIRDSLPAGELRDRYDVALGNLKDQIGQSITGRNAQTSQKNAVIGAIHAAQNPAPQGAAFETVDMGKAARLKGLWDRNDQMHGPKADKGGNPIGMNPGDYALVQAEAPKINKNRAIYHEVKSAFEDINKRGIAAVADFPAYEVYKDHMISRLVGAGIPQDIARNQVKAYMPDFKDLFSPKSLATKADQMWREFQLNEAGPKTILGQYGLMPKFPPPPKISGKEAAPAKAGAAPAPVKEVIRTDPVTGKKFKRGPNGKGIEVK